MQKIDIKKLYKDLESYNGKNITLAGWVKSTRDSKNFGFMDLNDGTCFKNAQIVFNAEELKNCILKLKSRRGSADNLLILSLTQVRSFPPSY